MVHSPCSREVWFFLYLSGISVFHLVLLALSMATNANRQCLFHSITARIYSHGSDSLDFLLTEQSQPLPKWQIFLTLKHFCAPLLNLLHCQSCTGQITPGGASALLGIGGRRNPSSYMLSAFPDQSRIPLDFFSARTRCYSAFCPEGALSSSWQSYFPASCLRWFLTQCRIWDYSFELNEIFPTCRGSSG